MWGQDPCPACGARTHTQVRGPRLPEASPGRIHLSTLLREAWPCTVTTHAAGWPPRLGAGQRPVLMGSTGPLAPAVLMSPGLYLIPLADSGLRGLQG